MFKLYYCSSYQNTLFYETQSSILSFFYFFGFFQIFSNNLLSSFYEIKHKIKVIKAFRRFLYIKIYIISSIFYLGYKNNSNKLSFWLLVNLVHMECDCSSNARRAKYRPYVFDWLLIIYENIKINFFIHRIIDYTFNFKIKAKLNTYLPYLLHNIDYKLC